MSSILLRGRFYLVAVFSFLRKSNLVSDSQALSLKLLRRRDRTFTDHGAMLPVFATKTIQFTQRSLCIPLPFVPRSVLCPVASLHTHVRLNLAPQATRFFRFTLSALLVFEPSLTLSSLPFLLGLYRPLGPIPHAFLLIVLGEEALLSHLNVVYPPS